MITKKPEYGIVLSGGGARGLAHKGETSHYTNIKHNKKKIK